MKKKVISVSETMPISLEDVKGHLRVLHSDEDALIADYFKAAVAKAEEITNRSLYSRVVEIITEETETRLPMSPVQEIESVTLNGVENAYTIDDYMDPPVITTDIGSKIRYTAGYIDIPANIRAWIYLYTATLYENRENIVDGASVNVAKAQYFDHLLDSIRVIPL